MVLPPELMLHHVRAGAHDYLYCARSNQVFRVTEAMLHIIPLFERSSFEEIARELAGIAPPEEVADGYEKIARLARQRGFFRRGPLEKRVEPRAGDLIRAELSRDIGQLCLEVTQACNLRCHYCSFSGGYAWVRQHGSATMPWSVAAAAIDFFFEKNRDCDVPFAVGFFGGEPLTQLSLIEACVKKARALPWRHPEALSFNLTTNGTLLDEVAVRRLRDASVEILLSLDGPSEDHDTHRVFANGGGTFEKVMANARGYAAETGQGLSVNCTISPTSDLLRISEFFARQDPLVGRLRLGAVAPGNEPFSRQYPLDRQTRERQVSALRQRFAEALVDATDPSRERPDLRVAKALFERSLLLFHRRRVVGTAPADLDVLSTCIPGKRKVFVRHDGQFNVCERINDTCSIGDVWGGFDLRAVERLLDQYVEIMNSERCRSCWATQLCQSCFATMAGDGRLSPERTTEGCDRTRRAAGETIQMYCDVLDRNPHAFDYMNDHFLA